MNINSFRMNMHIELLKLSVEFIRSRKSLLLRLRTYFSFLFQIGQSMTLEEAEKIIAEVDSDKDGRIDYAEFLNKVTYKMY